MRYFKSPTILAVALFALAGCNVATEDAAEESAEEEYRFLSDISGDADADEETPPPASGEASVVDEAEAFAGDAEEAEEATAEAVAGSDGDEVAAPERRLARRELLREIPTSDPDEPRPMEMRVPGPSPTSDTTPDAAAEDEPVDDAVTGDPGRAILAAETEMDVGEYHTVKLLVGEEDRVEDMTRAAESIGSATTSGPLELAPYICGELDANGFEVREPLRQCQQRGRSPQVSFTWNVSPISDRALTLRAKAITYDRENGSAMDQRDSQTLQIVVNADIFDKFNFWVRDMTESMGGLRNLLLAILAVLGVVSAIIWRIRNLGNSPDAGEVEQVAVGTGDAEDGPTR